VKAESVPEVVKVDKAEDTISSVKMEDTESSAQVDDGNSAAPDISSEPDKTKAPLPVPSTIPVSASVPSAIILYHQCLRHLCRPSSWNPGSIDESIQIPTELMLIDMCHRRPMQTGLASRKLLQEDR